MPLGWSKKVEWKKDTKSLNKYPNLRKSAQISYNKRLSRPNKSISKKWQTQNIN